MENSEQSQRSTNQPSEQAPQQSIVSSTASHKSRVFLFIILGILVIFIGYILLIGFPENTKCGQVLACHGIPLNKQCLGYKSTFAFIDCAKTGTQTSMPTISPIALDETANPDQIGVNWKIYTNENLQYEFRYPSNPLEPMRVIGDTSFVVGYFLDGGNPNDVRDVQNPDKTYWISLGYISKSQLSVMGITYCGANPNDSSRCESRMISGQISTIDWNIPVEYTIINDNGKDEKATQIKASVWIFHPKGGVVTFELQPVVPKSKETLNQILSTFKFTN